MKGNIAATLLLVTFLPGIAQSAPLAFDTPAQPAAVADPLMAYTLVPTDASDLPLAGPIVVGQSYFLDVNVQDLRAVSYAGVAAADVDIALTEQGGGQVGTIGLGPAPGFPNPIPNMTDFPVPANALHGDVTSTPNLLAFIQGAENIASDPQTGTFYYPTLGSTIFTLDRIEMIATLPGTVDFSAQIGSGEPTVLASGTGVKDVNDSLILSAAQISLGTASVTILPAPEPSSLALLVIGAMGLLVVAGRSLRG